MFNRYFLALVCIGCVCLAAGARYGLGWDIYTGPWFALTVAGASYRYGRGPGGAAAAVGAVGYDYFIVAPVFEIDPANPSMWPIYMALAAAVFVPRVRRQAHTSRELVDAIGGETIAEAFGLHLPEVLAWRDSGHIPVGWHYRLHVLADRRGLAINPALFGADLLVEGEPKRALSFSDR